MPVSVALRHQRYHSRYRSAGIETALKARGLTSHIHRKGKRGKPQTEQAQKSKRTKSTVWVRIEHIFGAQANDMGGTLVRTIGLVRAKAKIGMKNLAYNIRRLGQLGSGLIDHIQKMTIAAMAMADMKVWAQRS